MPARWRIHRSPGAFTRSRRGAERGDGYSAITGSAVVGASLLSPPRLRFAAGCEAWLSLPQAHCVALFLAKTMAEPQPGNRVMILPDHSGVVARIQDRAIIHTASPGSE